MKVFGHVERTENDRNVKSIYVGKCAGSRSVDRPRKWIDIMKDCLKKEVWISGKQIEGYMIGEYGEGCEGECVGLRLGESPLMAQLWAAILNGALEGWKDVLWSTPQPKSIKGKFSVFLHFLKL